MELAKPGEYASVALLHFLKGGLATTEEASYARDVSLDESNYIATTVNHRGKARLFLMTLEVLESVIHYTIKRSGIKICYQSRSQRISSSVC